MIAGMRSGIPRQLALALLAAGALALPACGGDDEDDGGGGEALTKAQLVSQADAICRDLNQKVDALPEPESVEDIETFAQDLLDTVEPAVADLKALVPPSEVEADYDRAMELLDNQVERTRELQEAGKEGDEAKVRSVIASGEKDDAEGDRIARKIGLKECGED